MTPLKLLLPVFALAFGMILAQPTVAHPEQENSWVLFTITEGGTFSFLRYLTKSECEFALNRARGWSATEEERRAEERAFDAIGKRREQFAQENSCSMDDVWITSGPSSVYNGKCVFGQEYHYPNEGTFTINPSDIRHAECIP